MSNSRRCILGLTGGAVVLPMVFWASQVWAANHALHMRWDIISLTDCPDREGVTLSPGGEAVAFAADGSRIRLTGEGTFVVNSGARHPQAVTGGGTWKTFDDLGNLTGSGTYVATGLVQWTLAPGEISPIHCDEIGVLENTRAGLAVFQVAYSDGSKGLLMVNCTLAGPIQTPPSVYEGVTATKGFVDYTSPEPLVKPDVVMNPTLFHIL